MPNVFEFLGLPATHRGKNKVVQLVKNYGEVPSSKKSFPLIAQPKEDGVFGMVVMSGGKVSVFGRTGEQLQSTSFIIRLASELMIDGVLIGEILSKHPCSLEELSGVVNPNRVNPLDGNQLSIASGLYIALHDFITLQDFVVGKCIAPYDNRYKKLKGIVEDSRIGVNLIQCTTIYDEESLNRFTETCLANKKEGAVYKKPGEGWLAGHKGYRSMKVVGEVSYDLLCIGYEEGSGKYSGKVANLVFKWKDGQTIRAMLGKGWTHKDAEDMFKYIQMGCDSINKANPIGCIFKVKGLMDSSKGKIRLPKVEELRHDKIKGDY